MLDLHDVTQRQKRGNQILFRPDSPCLIELHERLEQTDRQRVVLWALAEAALLVTDLQRRYPKDHRPSDGLQACQGWARGELKMPQTKPRILAVHQMAKEVSNPVDQALLHGLGQALATVHSSKHAIGWPMYQLTALVRDHGLNEALIEQQIRKYQARLDQLAVVNLADFQWATFLQTTKKQV